ncbi:hypothetical protein BCR39DRAFT_163672 [Naematelia encephala]|uniref:Uncharacterized protein n=1 Tax=Naematelia encephala TaxID=71784 RepID=A0A1Y2B4R3_9TREE|nr:hypothetical protein BCR39DRAFT_163672 [Naematelia encephala]
MSRDSSTSSRSSPHPTVSELPPQASLTAFDPDGSLQLDTDSQGILYIPSFLNPHTTFAELPFHEPPPSGSTIPATGEGTDQSGAYTPNTRRMADLGARTDRLLRQYFATSLAMMDLTQPDLTDWDKEQSIQDLERLKTTARETATSLNQMKIVLFNTADESGQVVPSVFCAWKHGDQVEDSFNGLEAFLAFRDMYADASLVNSWGDAPTVPFEGSGMPTREQIEYDLALRRAVHDPYALASIPHVDPTTLTGVGSIHHYV